MNHLSQKINRACENDPEIAELYGAFEEINKVYEETLEIMGKTEKHTSVVWNSSDVTISFHCMPASYGL